VARLEVGDDAGYLFGAMLPDLVTMVSVRVPESLPDRIADGCRAHHRIDAQFHDDATFRAGVVRMRTRLRERGVATGTSRGAAHVGYELLVDRALPWDDAVAQSVRAALADGRRITDRFDRTHAARWAAMLERLAAADLDPSRATVDEIARRVEIVLARRPRLAMADGDVEHLAAVLAVEADVVAAETPRLLSGASGAST
jgi:hypothetical protein